MKNNLKEINRQHFENQKNASQTDNNQKLETKNFDVVIIGGGVAGMSAAVYAKRRGRNVAILERMALGGTAATLTRIENFPSYASVDGVTLTENFVQQLKHLEVPVIFDDICETDLSSERKLLFGKKANYVCESVVIATGLSYEELPLETGAQNFVGRGVSYCVECDAHFFKGQDVCVASYNGSGLFAANKLAKICGKTVTVIDSGDLSVFATANKNPQIRVVHCANIAELKGENVLKEIVVKSTLQGNEKQTEIKTNALFVCLGRYAKTNIFTGLKTNAQGFIETNDNMKTNIPNVFAVGDVRAGVLKQIVTAANDGAIAGSLC